MNGFFQRWQNKILLRHPVRLRQGISGDPLSISRTVSIVSGVQPAILLDAQVYKIVDSIAYGFTVNDGIRKVAMAQVTKQGKASHSSLSSLTPRTILVLVESQPIERLDHCLFHSHRILYAGTVQSRKPA